MATIRNINDAYGEALEFTGETLSDAVQAMQDAIRECGAEFAGVVVTSDDYEVVERVEGDETRRYRVYSATTEHGGVQGLGQGDEYYEAETAAEAAQMAADDWGWDADDWGGGDVIVATDDDGDSYHLHR